MSVTIWLRSFLIYSTQEFKVGNHIYFKSLTHFVLKLTRSVTIMSKEDLNIDRINELAKKKKEKGLTEEEAKEQSKLRKQYLDSFRKGFKQQLENTKVIDPEGNDVTPEKLKNSI